MFEEENQIWDRLILSLTNVILFIFCMAAIVIADKSLTKDTTQFSNKQANNNNNPCLQPWKNKSLLVLLLSAFKQMLIFLFYQLCFFFLTRVMFMGII